MDNETKFATKKKQGPPKGVSNNPSGRPKLTEQERDLRELARAKSPDALAVMVQIMEHGESERNRLHAAELIIERGYGKPTQPIDATIMTHEQMLDMLK